MYSKLFEYFTIVSWSALWFIGGLFLAAFAFKLPRRERLIVGIALGLVLQAWFSNLMAYLMPVPYSFWAGAFLVFGFGIFCVWPFSRQNWRDLFSISVWQVVILTFLLYLFVSIGRGLDIFDDFQNLPVSNLSSPEMIAAIDARVLFLETKYGVNISIINGTRSGSTYTFTFQVTKSTVTSTLQNVVATFRKV